MKLSEEKGKFVPIIRCKGWNWLTERKYKTNKPFLEFLEIDKKKL